MKIPEPGYHQSLKIRRILAALLVAGAFATWLWPEKQDLASVVVFTHELPPGHLIKEEDVTEVQRPEETLPSTFISSTEEVVGQHIVTGVVPGEIATTVRLAGLETVETLGIDMEHPVMVPVRLADATSASLVKHGDEITVVSESVAIASGGVVVYTDPGSPDTILMLFEAEDAHHVASQSLSSPLAVVITG